MINQGKNFIIWLCISLTSTLYAQNHSGIITYRGVINTKHVDNFLSELKHQDIPMHIKQGVVEMYMNAVPDEYVLNFKNDESYFYHQPKLETNDGLTMGSKAGTNSYYTNNGTGDIIESSSLGYVSHKPLDWEITNQTKIIGGYKCYKAVATEKLYSRQDHYYYKKVIAWFAPSIPLNFGPKYYKGLPGLILKIERDKFTITATKLNFNPPSKEVRIKRLGENNAVITQEEANHRIAELMEDRRKSR